MITNGTHTYTIFSYTPGEISWSAIGNESVVTGYNAGGLEESNIHSFGISNAGGGMLAGDVEGCMTQGNPTEVLMLPRDVEVQLSAMEEQKAIEDCQAAYQDDIDFLSQFSGGCDLHTVISSVEPCPCTLQQANRDCRFTRDQTISPEKMCFLQKLPLCCVVMTRADFVQQCCYDSYGYVSHFAYTHVSNVNVHFVKQ